MFPETSGRQQGQPPRPGTVVALTPRGRGGTGSCTLPSKCLRRALGTGWWVDERASPASSVTRGRPCLPGRQCDTEETAVWAGLSYPSSTGARPPSLGTSQEWDQAGSVLCVWLMSLSTVCLKIHPCRSRTPSLHTEHYSTCYSWNDPCCCEHGHARFCGDQTSGVGLSGSRLSNSRWSQKRGVQARARRGTEGQLPVTCAAGSFLWSPPGSASSVELSQTPEGAVGGDSNSPTLGLACPQDAAASSSHPQGRCAPPASHLW